MSKPLHLNQIIALDKTIKPRVHSTTSELYKKLQKVDLFNGQNREYKPLNDDDKEVLPAESNKVQCTVAENLLQTKKSLADLWDITARREYVNTKATANIVVDDNIILSSVPVGTLLFLEKQLIDLKTTFEHIPTLTLNDDWNFDEKSSLYKTGTIQTHRSKKTPKVIVKFPATTEHPAQTEIFMEDNIVGYWQATKLSGAMSVSDKQKLLVKVEKLINAVKVAREEANSTKEDKVAEISSALFSYIGLGD